MTTNPDGNQKHCLDCGGELVLLRSFFYGEVYGCKSCKLVNKWERISDEKLSEDNTKLLVVKSV